MASHDGFLKDVSIAFIEKTDPFHPLRREDYWRQTLKTMVPHGLNIEENIFKTSRSFCFYFVTSVFFTR